MTTDPTNDSRAAHADAAIKRFRKVCPTDMDDAVADLLANLMHWCDRNPEFGDFDRALRIARMNYSAEIICPNA